MSSTIGTHNNGVTVRFRYIRQDIKRERERKKNKRKKKKKKGEGRNKKGPWLAVTKKAD